MGLDTNTHANIFPTTYFCDRYFNKIQKNNSENFLYELISKASTTSILGIISYLLSIFILRECHKTSEF